jgi:hypothetical protein
MLPALLDELVRLKPDVLIAGKGGEVTPVAFGLVASHRKLALLLQRRGNTFVNQWRMTCRRSF